MDQKIENQIVAAVLKGDKQSYALLVEKHQSPIYNLAYRMTGSHQDAADLTQETFIRAYLYLWRYDTRKKFFTWLYTLSLNIIKNHLRKSKKQKTVAFINTNQLIDNETLKETKLIDEQEINLALMRLDNELRSMLIMKYQQGLSFEEIAEITGKTLSAVKMRVYRGLEKLKELISK
jgi:RNA polymerase sigma-70 factor, ECF subfamily